MPLGRPTVVPDDGLTTRERRQQPLLIVHTGDGKGKTTAALGLALRGWAQGWSVGVFQFVKSGAWQPGEHAALAELDRAHRDHGVGGPVDWHTMGAGWTWSRATAAADQAALAAEGWAEVARRLTGEAHTLYVLDEFTYPLARGWVDIEEVVATLQARPGVQHVVVTGRGCPPALLDAADLVTEMTKVRHPFDRGQKGQRGIEW